MQLLGVRLRSQTTYAAPDWFWSWLVQELIRFKNSDLKSKLATGTGYIQQVAKQILRVLVLGKPQILLVVILVISQHESEPEYY
jgi:hypothetical protein